MTSLMIHLSWKDSKDIHPSNSASDFIVEFPKTIKLEKDASVELVEFMCRLDTKTNLTLYVLCDICEYSIACSGIHPILRSVDFKGKRSVITNFPDPFKISIRDHNLTRCRLYLKEEHMKDPSFRVVDSRVTLRINNVITQ